MLRTDRRTNKRGGGVLLAMSTDIQYKEVDLSPVNDIVESIDAVGIHVNNGNKSILIILVYIPPTTYHQTIQLFFERLQICTDISSNTILIGDFNIHGFDDNKPRDRKYETLSNFFIENNFKQMNKIVNSNGGILDLIAVNGDIKVAIHKETMPILQEDQYHPTIIINANVKVPKLHNFPAVKSKMDFNFKLADFHALYSDILNCSWEKINQYDDVNTACDEFYQLINNILSKHVPLKHKSSKRYPCWFQEATIAALRNKNILYKKYKMSHLQSDHELFKHARQELKELVSDAFHKYTTDMEIELKHNPQKLWSFIKEKNNKTRIPGSMTYKDRTISGPENITEAFAEFFSSVYQSSSNVNTLSRESCYTNVNISKITEKDVIFASKELNNSNATGNDNLPTFVVQDCIHVWAKPLSILYNKSLNQNIFPDMWKQSRVVPILKNGSPNCIENYRPITIIPVFAKIYERILHNKIFKCVKHQISVTQHGFFEKRSTVTNLMTKMQIITNNMNHSIQTDVIYTDFQKAFDSIDHLMLIDKLANMGFSKELLSFFCSYLHARKLHVFYCGAKSKEFIATSGVPQGTNLAALLFSIYINDLPNAIDTDTLLFADDFKLIKTIRTERDAVDLQQQINNVLRWCGTNKLHLNIRKCSVLSYTKAKNPILYPYTLGEEILLRVQQIKDLGITFQNDLSFKSHIKDITKSAYRTLGMVIRNCKHFESINTLQTLYRALIRPKLEYGTQIWSPKESYLVDTIEGLQRKFLKFLYFKQHGTYPETGIPEDNLLVEFKTDSLYKRRVCADINFIKKLINGDIDSTYLLANLNFYVPRVNSIVRATFYVNQSNRDTHKFAPLNRMCSAVNEHFSNLDIFCASMTDIRTALETRE